MFSRATFTTFSTFPVKTVSTIVFFIGSAFYLLTTFLLFYENICIF